LQPWLFIVLAVYAAASLPRTAVATAALATAPAATPATLPAFFPAFFNDLIEFYFCDHYKNTSYINLKLIYKK
jgi:hypothetical protein